MGLTAEGSISYRKFCNLHKWEKQYVSNVHSELQGCDALEPNDVISRIFEEVFHIDTMANLEAINTSHPGIEVMKVNSLDMYEVLSQIYEELEDAMEARLETKYKTIAKKVRPVAVPLLEESGKVIEKASQQPTLRDMKRIGHKFSKETLDLLKIGGDGFLTEEEIKCFREMLATHGKAIAFEPHEILRLDALILKW